MTDDFRCASAPMVLEPPPTEAGPASGRRGLLGPDHLGAERSAAADVCAHCGVALLPMAEPAASNNIPSPPQDGAPCDGVHDRRGGIATAWHEAAHAVFVILGFGVIDRASIRAEGDARGVVEFCRLPTPLTRDFDVLNFCAGPIAGTIVAAGVSIDRACAPPLPFAEASELIEGLRRSGGACCGQDGCRAICGLIAANPGASAFRLWTDFGRARDRALGILRDPAIWRAVEAVATVLIERGEVDDDVVRPLVYANAHEAMLQDIRARLGRSWR